MNIIAGTTSQFKNIPKLQSLLKQSKRKAHKITREIGLVSNEDYIKSRELRFTTDTNDPYIKLTDEIYINTVNSGYDCFVSDGGTKPILWLDILPKDPTDSGKISRNIKGIIDNMPLNVWVHEAYHMIAGVGGETLPKDAPIEVLCKNREETIATYMEILYLEENGYSNEQIAYEIGTFDDDIENFRKFLELTSEYLK